jgi:hypothetical protein
MIIIDLLWDEIRFQDSTWLFGNRIDVTLGFILHNLVKTSHALGFIH